jgi:DNA-binding CsgD family transcriptional regulator
VRAGYGLSSPDRDWLDALVTTARALLDRGDGLMAYTYDTSSSTVRFGEYVATGTAEAAFERLAECVARQDAAVQHRLYRTAGAFGSVSQNLGIGEGLEQAPFFVDRFHPLGVKDFLAMNATDPSGAGVVLCAPLRGIYAASASARARWSRAASHVAAAFRLRRALGTANPMVDAEAILTPSGRVEHATGPAEAEHAREALRRATLVLESATKKKARGPEALRAWTALVEGRWSVVDCFDTDGKRYVVARKNDPAVSVTMALTEQEAQVLAYARLGHGMKLVAYELGLPVSTVAVLLERGLQKIGLRSRQELVSLMGDA